MCRTRSKLAKLFSVLILSACFTVAANAQFRAGLQGTVTDNSGGVVPGATVTLTSKETNQSLQTVTSDDGFYRFSQLAPGLY
ncbi:MAG TPA: carboxypeptidase-like regulatory domain-containing protein, partial [Pyrinomonadaceae bacterium]|nr:carboxypeptidase-like regulatory domain-containing protein [Pyrinomonadaceae bacterium]